MGLVFQSRCICYYISANAGEGVIHGDIKPSNILVFEPLVGVFTARVADFGYASVELTDDHIYLPQSIPWNHPRLHSRTYTFCDAACTDIYSLGLLCFWMFFNEDKNYLNDKRLTTLKLEGNMPQVVQSFKDTFVGFNSNETRILSSVFDMTLVDDDDKRSSIHELFNMLQESWLNMGDSSLSKFQTPVSPQMYIMEQPEFQVRITAYVVDKTNTDRSFVLYPNSIF